MIPGFNFDYTDPFDATNPWKPSYILEDIIVSYSQESGSTYYSQSINGIQFKWCKPKLNSLDPNECATGVDAAQWVARFGDDWSEPAFDPLHYDYSKYA